MSKRYAPMKPTQTGLKGRCPRCGQGNLFSGWVKVADQCEVCGLKFSFSDSGDGPAFFVSMIGMIPVALFTVWMEVAVGAPIWLNVALTIPLLLAFCVLPLKPLKGLMIAQQYNHDAGEGQIDTRD